MRRFLPIFLFIVSACGREYTDKSEITWGALKSGTINSLFDVSPGQKVSICSNDTYLSNRVISAVNTFSRHVGRKLNLRKTNNCYTNSPSIAVKYSQNCNPGVVGYRRLTGKKNDIVICRKSKVYPIILHEVGHAFGLCDQYDQNLRIAFHNNCHLSIRSRKAQRSIMNSFGVTDRLTVDDVIGLQVMSCLSTYSNQQWMKKNPSAPRKYHALAKAEIKRISKRWKMVPQCNLY